MQWEIQQPWQARCVTIGVGLTRLPIGQNRWIQAPLFAAHIELGIGIHDRTTPSAHKSRIGIWIGVHSNATNPEVLDPPQRILNEVIGQQWLPLVEVRHSFYKPTIREAFDIGLGCIWIAEGCPAMRCWDECVVVVDPIPGWQILHPRMLGPAMVHDHVHDDFHALIPGTLH